MCGKFHTSLRMVQVRVIISWQKYQISQKWLFLRQKWAYKNCCGSQKCRFFWMHEIWWKIKKIVLGAQAPQKKNIAMYTERETTFPGAPFPSPFSFLHTNFIIYPLCFLAAYESCDIVPVLAGTLDSKNPDPYYSPYSLRSQGEK